jgi:hypothetical protein
VSDVGLGFPRRRIVLDEMIYTFHTLVAMMLGLMFQEESKLNSKQGTMAI